MHEVHTSTNAQGHSDQAFHLAPRLTSSSSFFLCDVQVTVLLKPLSLSPPPRRSLILLLSSQVPLHWLLDAEQLPSDLSVLVQVSHHYIYLNVFYHIKDH